MELSYTNEKFQETFEQATEKIKLILESEVIKIEHIGSSAVPNVLTKPIVDILVVVEDIDQIDQTNQFWEAEGYEVKGEAGIPYRRYFRNEKPEIGVHIHIFDRFSKKEIVRHLAFRDFLRTHPDICADYTRVKQQILRTNCTREQYQQQKANFVQAVEKLALVWRETLQNK